MYNSKLLIVITIFHVTERLDSTKMSAATCVDRSVHSANIEEIHNVPMRVIHRPIPPVLDDDKVKSLMETLEVFSASFRISYCD